MVAFVGGAGLGLFNSSLGVIGGDGARGNSSVGRSGEQVYVNTTSGNLVVQRQDDYLAASGADIALLRTYNSQGLMNDDNGDNWRMGVARTLGALTGTVNTAGSTITRTDGDGVALCYTCDASGNYINKDGGGAFDKMTYDGGGRLASYIMTADGATPVDYRYTYNSRDAGRVDAIEVLKGHVSAITFNNYDANGFITQVTTSGSANAANARTLSNDVHGRVLRKVQDGHTTFSLIANGEVIGSSSDTGAPAANTFASSYVPISDAALAAGPSAYTVQPGETLQSIAKSVWGNANLWYLLADANGKTAVTTGEVIVIPGRQNTVLNDYQTFAPYSPGQAIGDQTPVLPKPKKSNWLKQLVVMIIAIVVAYLTQQWYLVEQGIATVTAAAEVSAAALSNATLASVGAATPGASMAAGAIGAAAGSMASQGAGLALGTQDRFSWRGVALSALSGGIGGALAGAGADFGMGRTGNMVARATAGQVASQGIGVATGLQKSFDWRGVAASAVGAGVGQSVSGAIGNSFGNDAFGQFATRAVSGFAAGTAAAVMRGGKVVIQQVATDAFGNALSYSLVDAMRTDPTETPLTGNQREAMEQGYGPLNPNASSRAMLLSKLDLRSNFAPTDGADQFVPIDSTGPGTSVMGAGKALSLEQLRREEIGYRNRTEGMQDADMRWRGPRASAADIAGYETLGKEMTGWQVNKAFRANDPNHFVIGAFLDGTWNKRPGEDLLDTRPGADYTNVGLLELMSRGKSNYVTQYFPGVGTDWYTKHIGGATGAGVTMGAEEAYGWMVKQANAVYAKNSNASFDFLASGFSRGALEGRLLLRIVDERGIPDTRTAYEVPYGEAGAQVRFDRNIIEPGKASLNAVIFDTVTTGAGDFYNIDLPPRVQVYHAVARDEMRTLFPSAPLARGGQAISPSWFERVVAGDHSDIGNNHDRGGIGDMNLKLAHQFMTQNLGLPMMAIPSAYTPKPQNMWIHDMRGDGGVAPFGSSPFVRPVAPRYLPLQPNLSLHQR